jgi:UMF1 family MFS transporter
MTQVGESGQENAAENGGAQGQDDVATRGSSSKMRALACPDGVVTRTEVWAWYTYDFANSPFWQVFDLLGKVLMKRLAELADFPKGGISAGSYPAVVLWINAACQVISLLSFSAFGDFGPYRKRLLLIMTASGSFFVFMHIILFSPGTWWVAAVLRILAGQAFILSNVYYNAFLSILAEQHYDVVNQSDDCRRADRQVEVSDEMSAKGYIVGYSGGVIMQLIVYGLLLGVECDDQTQDRRLLPAPKTDTTSECSQFNKLFWLCLSVSIVGLWWAGFSLFTFRHVKQRAGPDFPKDTNIILLGWKQACEALRMICQMRPLLLFVIAYFLWSDALNTIVNAAILTLDDSTSKDSSIMLNSFLGAFAGLIGVLIVLKVQQYFNISNKAMLLAQLVLYVIVSLAGAVGVVKTMDGYGYYVVMVPAVLMMGSLQANTRSLFSALVPVGSEASMFAFYAITDKGSSLLGFGVISLVHSTTGEYTAVFWYTMLAFLISAGILWFVDVNKGLVDAGRAAVKCDS